MQNINMKAYFHQIQNFLKNNSRILENNSFDFYKTKKNPYFLFIF